MMNTISEMKEMVMHEAQQLLASGNLINRQNLDTFGKLCDAIKDLAEAEHHCQEGMYYKAVNEGMGVSSMGYSGMRMGATGSSANGGAMPTHYGSSMGYNENRMMDNIREIMRNADPIKKEQLRMEMQRLMQE